MKPTKEPASTEDLEKFRSWLVRYLCRANIRPDDILIKRLHNYVSELCEYERGFSERLENEKAPVVQFQPRHNLQLITNEVSK
jgi:hypothetical protein